MTDAALPVKPPQEPVPSTLQPQVPRSGRRMLLWLVVLVVILLSASGLYWKRQATQQAEQAGRATSAVRTATIGGGSLERTLRLTGVTAAENYAALISPQMRGSRSGFGRQGRDRGGSDMPQQVQSTGGRGSSGSTPSVSTGSSSGGSSGGSTVASTAGSSTTSSFAAATSRNARTSTSTRSSSSGSGTAAASSTLGADGLGTTSGSLGQGTGGGPGGGGGGGGGMVIIGGGGMSEFGLVLQSVAKPGSQVKKGEVVAEFDRQNMLNRLDDYRASVIQNEASLRKQKAQLEVTRKAHEQQVLAAKGAVDKAELDLKTVPVRSAIESERFRLALEETQARHKQLLAEVKYIEISELSQIRNAEIELAQAKIELQRSEANADRMISKAPIDGLVVMQQTFRGGEFGQIQQGDQVFSGQPFMQIVDLRSMVINATVNQADVESLRIGQSARVRFDAYPELELPAKIYSIGAMTRQGGFRASFLKEIPVRLRLERTDPRVIPDLSVSADVIVERDEQASVIAPLEAVFEDAGSNKPYALVRRTNGWEKREIELGLANNIMVAIRSGLKPGDAVALSHPAQAAQPNGGVEKK